MAIGSADSVWLDLLTGRYTSEGDRRATLHSGVGRLGTRTEGQVSVIACRRVAALIAAIAFVLLAIPIMVWPLGTP